MSGLCRFGWEGFERSPLAELRRQMDRLFADFEPGGGFWAGGPAAWPALNFSDTGAALVLTADLPGFGEKDIEVSVSAEAVTLSGERKVQAPDGYSVHRNERASLEFSRSIALPCKIDGDSFRRKEEAP